MHFDEGTTQNTGYYADPVRCRGEASLARILGHRGFNARSPRATRQRLRLTTPKSSLGALLPPYLFVEASPELLAQLVVAESLNFIVRTGEQPRLLAEISSMSVDLPETCISVSST
jgi:hypothetical protein